MRQKLSDSVIKKLTLPASGQAIHYDSDVAGFGVRLTPGGQSFILNYRTRGGRERRYTIGPFSTTGQGWNTSTARGEAERLKATIRLGADPVGELTAERTAETVADLAKRFREEHLPKKRESTGRNYAILLDRFILPALRSKKVRDVTFTDIDALHRKITKGGTPGQANRSMAVLSKMFTLAIKWGWTDRNPVKGVERNPETRRQRYLSQAEIAALSEALTTFEDRQAADIFRLLLLTGARSGEVMGAKWEHFDLKAGVWTKPGSTTKQKTTHRVPLSAPARLLLVEVRQAAEAEAEKQDKEVSAYVFPGRGSDHRIDVHHAWEKLCKAAGLVAERTVRGRDGKARVEVLPSARIHDLRHTYASVLASSGLSLPIIGALLGHSQPATTARYAHLLDDPLRQATERVGAIVTGRPSAEVVPLRSAG